MQHVRELKQLLLAVGNVFGFSGQELCLELVVYLHDAIMS